MSACKKTFGFVVVTVRRPAASYRSVILLIKVRAQMWACALSFN